MLFCCQLGRPLVIWNTLGSKSVPKLLYVPPCHISSRYITNQHLPEINMKLIVVLKVIQY